MVHFGNETNGIDSADLLQHFAGNITFQSTKPSRYSVRFELSAKVLDSAERLEHTSQQLDWLLPQSGN